MQFFVKTETVNIFVKGEIYWERDFVNYEDRVTLQSSQGQRHGIIVHFLTL